MINKPLKPFVIAVIIASLSQTGSYSAIKDTTIPSDPHVGKVGSFGIPLSYYSDCTGCGGSPTTLDINRELSCFDKLGSLGQHNFKGHIYNVNYVRSSMKFKIVAVDRIDYSGLNAIESAAPTMLAILKDENGLQSTALLNLVVQSRAFRINSVDGALPAYDQGRELCMNQTNPDIVKLFKYIENKGKARVVATVFDLNTHKSDASVQRAFIRALGRSARKYKITDPEPMASPIPGMVGVAVDVDPDALVYLVAAKLDLHVWDISCLDADCEKPLTPKKAPLGMKSSR